MRPYAKTYSSFWDGPIGERIAEHGLEAFAIAHYLVNNRHTSMIGLYKLPVPYISVDTKCSLEKAQELLNKMVEVDFASYDPQTQFVWVHEMARYQVGQGLNPKDKQCAAVRSLYSGLPANPFLEPFFNRYHKDFHLQPHKSITTRSSLRSGEDNLSNPFEGVDESDDSPFKPGTRARAPTGVGTGARQGTESTWVGPKTVQPSSTGVDVACDCSHSNVIPVELDCPVQVHPSQLKTSPKTREPTEDDFIDPRKVPKDETVEARAKRLARIDRRTAVVERVFAYYVQALGRQFNRYKLSKARFDKGFARLQEALIMRKESAPTMAEIYENAENLMLVAVDQLAASDWHTGRDSTTAAKGRKYIAWEDHLFPSEEKFQTWLGHAYEAEKKHDQAQAELDRRQQAKLGVGRHA